MKAKIYDFAAIGIGPFNLGLACLSHPIKKFDGIFLDQKPFFDWHPGMMINDTTLQIPFLADLVTLADPTSPFSFLNYIKEQGRIYSFYIRENFQLLRYEYNQYCKWVIEKLPDMHFNRNVQSIVFDKNQNFYVINSIDSRTGDNIVVNAKKIVLGTGTVPYIPKSCHHLTDIAVHSSSYLDSKRALQLKKTITIVGSGQSAAEVFYDLLQEIDIYGYELNWITRSPRFFPMEYSKMTLEMTSPEYVDYFYNLPPTKKEELISNQKQLYKGINNGLIGAIYDLLYSKQIISDVKVSLRTNSYLTKAYYDTASNNYTLNFYHEEQEKTYQHHCQGLILATGYNYQVPGFLNGIRNRIQWDEKGRYLVNRNYSIDTKGSEIFVQNAELHTHGFVTPDLGMGCYRNSFIIKEMTGKEHYRIEKRIAFQEFSCDKEEEVNKSRFAFV